MEVKAFREMTPEELERKVEELRKEYFDLRFELSTGQLEQTNKIKALKRDIARALTVKKEMAGAR